MKNGLGFFGIMLLATGVLTMAFVVAFIFLTLWVSGTP